MDGVKVYDARIRGGKSLAKSYPVEADLVTGVPESGLPAAKGFSEESGIPFGFAFYKNSYIGRTFIKPGKKMNIVAAVTAGDSNLLLPGRHGVFVDTQGQSWEGVLVKLVGI